MGWSGSAPGGTGSCPGWASAVVGARAAARRTRASGRITVTRASGGPGTKRKERRRRSRVEIGVVARVHDPDVEGADVDRPQDADDLRHRHADVGHRIEGEAG